MSLEFKDEMLVPSINGEVYFQVYEIENWYRRICLTAFMKAFGTDWINHIPSSVLNSFRSKFDKSQELLHLDLQGDDNLIWMTTHGELIQLLSHNDIASQVRSLTGFTSASLSQKLDELRYIRNTLAHNRAFSETTLVIVRGIIASLMQGVRVFKRQVLYSNYSESLMGKTLLFKDESGLFDNEVSQYFAMRESKYNSRRNQFYISLSKDIYSFVSLPVDRNGIYPSAARLLEAYRSAVEYILAFTLNKTGTEYCVLVPTATPNDKIMRVIDVFIPEPRIWTDTEFEKQNPKYICNPKIWFYESNRPLEE